MTVESVEDDGRTGRYLLLKSGVFARVDVGVFVGPNTVRSFVLPQSPLHLLEFILMRQ